MAEKVTYFNQPNCYRLSNGGVETIVTTDIGPRIIRYGFTGYDNLLGEVPETTIRTELGDWKPRGGHRLWAAPEARPRSYSPDNSPVNFSIEDELTIRLAQPVEPATGIEKEMTVRLAPKGTRLDISHRITNRTLWAISLAPWAITIMNGGGTVLIPQEPYISWDERLAPARPLVLWHYTDLSDTRFAIGPKLILFRADSARPSPQKIGVANKQGWAAYHRGSTLFVKRFSYQEGAAYADFGSNNEAYGAGDYMEIESLGPVSSLETGETAEHMERWYLFRDVRLGETEEEISRAVESLINQTDGF